MRLFAWLAQSDPPWSRVEAYQQYVRERQHDSSIWWGLVVLLGAAALLVLVLHVVASFERKRRKRPPQDAASLFRQCLHELRLPVADRALLQRMARGLDLNHPTMILISRSTLRWAVERWASQPDARHRPRPRELDHLREISVRLFGQPLDSRSDSPPGSRVGD